MKRNFCTLLALFLIFITVSHIPFILAKQSGVEFTPFNANLEGAKILHHRNTIKKDDGRKYDFLMAGTSRTMADFSPQIIAETYGNLRGTSQQYLGRNLGNIANYYVEFEMLYTQLPQHDVLVLEFSPHMLLGGLDEYQDRHNFNYFKEYRRRLDEFEFRLTGLFQKVIGFEERFVLNPRMIRDLYNHFVNKSISLKRLFTKSRVNNGYGQVLQADGQIFYYTYIPDEVTGESLRKYRSEYKTYKNKILKQPFSQLSFEAFKNIVLMESKIVVVRPPVARELYKLENTLAEEEVRMVEQFLQENNITYIDMNPGQWFSTDMSHIDWYDTAEVSRALATLLHKHL